LPCATLATPSASSACFFFIAAFVVAFCTLLCAVANPVLVVPTFCCADATAVLANVTSLLAVTTAAVLFIQLPWL